MEYAFTAPELKQESEPMRMGKLIHLERGTMQPCNRIEMKRLGGHNPLTPKGDWHLISPHHITSESNIKVRRVKDLIIN